MRSSRLLYATVGALAFVACTGVRAAPMPEVTKVMAACGKLEGDEFVACAAREQAPPPAPPRPAPPSVDAEAYQKAETCLRAYAVRFAATTAEPQDVAEAALENCHQLRFLAGVARANGYANQVTLTTLQADEPSLRRAAIGALLEARFLKKR